MACRDGTPYPTEWRNTRAVVLAEEFEAIRAFIGGKVIRVTSAYRTPEYNKKVGGKPKSQHLEGRALDLAPPRGFTPRQFFDAVVAYMEGNPDHRIRGLGQYPSTGHTHIDTRPGKRIYRWTV